jgi:hypothetical protein
LRDTWPHPLRYIDGMRILRALLVASMCVLLPCKAVVAATCLFCSQGAAVAVAAPAVPDGEPPCHPTAAAVVSGTATVEGHGPDAAHADCTLCAHGAAYAAGLAPGPATPPCPIASAPLMSADRHGPQHCPALPERPPKPDAA